MHRVMWPDERCVHIVCNEFSSDRRSVNGFLVSHVHTVVTSRFGHHDQSYASRKSDGQENNQVTPRRDIKKIKLILFDVCKHNLLNANNKLLFSKLQSQQCHCYQGTYPRSWRCGAGVVSAVAVRTFWCFCLQPHSKMAATVCRHQRHATVTAETRRRKWRHGGKWGSVPNSLSALWDFSLNTHTCHELS